MATDGMTPNLVCATTAVPPYRCCLINGIRTGTIATTGLVPVVGVSDGSTPIYSNTTNNAEIGGPINFQQGNTVQIEAGAAFNAGVALMPTTGGKVITAVGAGAFSSYVALETSGADGEIVWCYRCIGKTFLT